MSGYHDYERMVSSLCRPADSIGNRLLHDNKNMDKFLFTSTGESCFTCNKNPYLHEWLCIFTQLDKVKNIGDVQFGGIDIKKN